MYGLGTFLKESTRIIYWDCQKNLRALFSIRDQLGSLVQHTTNNVSRLFQEYIKIQSLIPKHCFCYEICSRNSFLNVKSTYHMLLHTPYNNALLAAPALLLEYNNRPPSCILLLIPFLQNQINLHIVRHMQWDCLIELYSDTVQVNKQSK